MVDSGVSIFERDLTLCYITCTQVCQPCLDINLHDGMLHRYGISNPVCLSVCLCLSLPLSLPTSLPPSCTRNTEWQTVPLISFSDMGKDQHLLTHSLSLSHTHTHIHTRTHACTHAHTRTHAWSVCFSPTPTPQPPLSVPLPICACLWAYLSVCLSRPLSYSGKLFH